MGFGHGPDAANIQRVAGEVGSVGADDGLGVGLDQSFKHCVIHASPFIGGHEVQRQPPLLLERAQGPQHGVVLQICGDGVVAGVEETLDRKIQAISTVLLNQNYLKLKRKKLRKKKSKPKKQKDCISIGMLLV